MLLAMPLSLLSRLKGIETDIVEGTSNLHVLQTLSPLSRLKGIETDWSVRVRVRLRDHFVSAFPFEGN